MPWLPGDIAECIETEWTMLGNDGQPAIPFGARRMVSGTEAVNLCGLELVGLRFVGSPWLYHEQSFRKIEPAPTQPHEAKALVGDTGKGKTSRPSVAVCTSTRIDAGEGTGGAEFLRGARSHEPDALTRRDLSQHADGDSADAFNFPVHGERL